MTPSKPPPSSGSPVQALTAAPPLDYAAGAGLVRPTFTAQTLDAARRIVKLVDSPISRAQAFAGATGPIPGESNETRARREITELAPILAFAILQAEDTTAHHRREQPSKVTDITLFRDQVSRVSHLLLDRLIVLEADTDKVTRAVGRQEHARATGRGDAVSAGGSPVTIRNKRSPRSPRRSAPFAGDLRVTWTSAQWRAACAALGYFEEHKAQNRYATAEIVSVRAGVGRGVALAALRTLSRVGVLYEIRSWGSLPAMFRAFLGSH